MVYRKKRSLEEARALAASAEAPKSDVELQVEALCQDLDIEGALEMSGASQDAQLCAGPRLGVAC